MLAASDDPPRAGAPGQLEPPTARRAAAVASDGSPRSPGERSRGSRHVMHSGPGVYDDYLPLMNRKTKKRLSRAKRIQMEDAFHSDFRMPSKAFRYIVREIGSDFKTSGGKYSREFAALSALWHLATGVSYREVGSSPLFDPYSLLTS